MRTSNISYAQELNEEQYAVVTAPPGSALVIAGAGSGKTRTLTYRVAWLLEQGVPAHKILLLTFTNKAAREMMERVSQLVAGASERIWSGTFHSIGNRILRRHAETIGYRKEFSIIDRQDQKDLMASVVSDSGMVTKGMDFPKADVLIELFSLSINTRESLQTVLLDKFPYFFRLSEEIQKIQVLYEGRKRETHSMDFDDLLSKVIALFQTAPEIVHPYQERFEHILVDEYQDTNRLQADLVDILAQKHRQVMVVGDDAQSIYSWRGANFENILEFPKRYPDTRLFPITTNYRSTSQILEVANAAIASNEKQFSKELRSVRDEKGRKPFLVSLETSKQQAGFVAERIAQLYDQGVDLQDIAILYRAHFHSLEIQMELTRRGIPFETTSGLRFFEQAHVKDMAAFLKFVVNPLDETAFKRMVLFLPGIGKKSADKLWHQARSVLGDSLMFERLIEGCKPPTKAKSHWEQWVHTLMELAPEGKPLSDPSEMLEVVLEAVYKDYMQTKFANYHVRYEDLTTLIQFAKSFETVDDFLSQLALLNEAESDVKLGAMDGETQKVTLSSIHQAKGLEWKIVFLIWMTEGMFPSFRSLESPRGIEEERRLFYVAVTRSRDELYLTWPRIRLGFEYGDPYQRPSRFLKEIPEELLELYGDTVNEGNDEEEGTASQPF